MQASFLPKKKDSCYGNDRQDLSLCGEHEREPMKRADRMKAVLEEALAPSVLEIRDDSARHRHHAAMRTASQESRGPDQAGETHYHLHVISRRFDGMKTLERHRLVHELLAEEFRTGLHALSLSLKGEAQA